MSCCKHGTRVYQPHDVNHNWRIDKGTFLGSLIRVPNLPTPHHLNPWQGPSRVCSQGCQQSIATGLAYDLTNDGLGELDQFVL